jgi:predicted glycoside hydrolase/deacetylase ChbG (UPF0249 family)
MRELAAELGIPLRGQAVAYCGDFYGQSGKGEPFPEAIEPDALISVIERLPAGVTEMACHPGLDAELDSAYRSERLREVETLCDPRVRAAIESGSVRLASFAELS